eukprot:Platyproteum_vivax@DN3888_c0_g1_i1.p1
MDLFLRFLRNTQPTKKPKDGQLQNIFHTLPTCLMSSMFEFFESKDAISFLLTSRDALGFNTFKFWESYASVTMSWFNICHKSGVLIIVEVAHLGGLLIGPRIIKACPIDFEIARLPPTFTKKIWHKHVCDSKASLYSLANLTFGIETYRIRLPDALKRWLSGGQLVHIQESANKDAQPLQKKIKLSANID